MTYVQTCRDVEKQHADLDNAKATGQAPFKAGNASGVSSQRNGGLTQD
ncbi:hypothetical protein ALP25_200002 [Pseudomonas syringae pv. syringae]|nr:hypothetical protein ALP25_200002 [Pseudomonas syringae pv. syringae]